MGLNTPARWVAPVRLELAQTPMRWRHRYHPDIPTVRLLMSIADELKSAIATVSAQIDAELASHLAASSQATAASDANAAALVDAIALVKALSAKMAPLPPTAEPAQ